MDDNEIIFKGEWFLPDNVTNKIKGILTYNINNEHCLLELFGCLFEYENFDNVDFILGNTYDGTGITLHRCHLRRIRGAARNKLDRIRLSKLNVQQSSSYEVDYIIKGAHIRSVDELSFDEIISEIFNLDEWLGIHGFSNVQTNFKLDGGLIVNLNYEEPDPIEFKINAELDGAFRFDATKSGLSQFQKEYVIKQTTYLTLLSKVSLSLSDCIDYLFKFQNFLITSTYKSVNISNLELVCDKIFDSIRVNENEYVENPKRVKVYFNHRRSVVRELPRTHFQMLFTYSDIKEDFPKIISSWFEKHKILNPTFNLIFYHFYRNEKAIDVFFLNLAQAAESFHYLLNFKNRDCKIFSKSEFEARKKKSGNH